MAAVASRQVKLIVIFLIAFQFETISHVTGF